MMIRALRYEAPRKASIVSTSQPNASGRTSIARTLATSVSAGTEMGFYRGTAPQFSSVSGKHGLYEPKDNAVTYPMQSDGPGVWWMGYSAVGEINEVGPDETQLKVGDKVWCQTGHKTYMASDNFLKLPDDVNVENATFLALLSITFNGMLDAGVKLLDDVVILGMGTLGQMLLQMSKLSGANVIAVDNLDSRLDLAEQTGADITFNPQKQGDLGQFVQEHTQGRGADVVIEVSGNVKALSDAIRCTSLDGTVTVLSFYQGGADSLVLGQEFHHKRIRLRSSQINHIDPALSNLYNNPRRLDQAVALLNQLDLQPLISHRVNFDDLPEALAMIDQNPSQCQSVLVSY
jgi:threonine dehydrogenase-like Zn-dependent dehydrogenase